MLWRHEADFIKSQLVLEEVVGVVVVVVVVVCFALFQLMSSDLSALIGLRLSLCVTVWTDLCDTDFRLFF